MKAIMNIENITSIEDLEQFLQGNKAIAFTILGDKQARYKFIKNALIKFRYMTLKKRDKGVLLRYLSKITTYSRQQLTRLIKQYRETRYITSNIKANSTIQAKRLRQSVWY